MANIIDYKKKKKKRTTRYVGKTTGNKAFRQPKTGTSVEKSFTNSSFSTFQFTKLKGDLIKDVPTVIDLNKKDYPKQLKKLFSTLNSLANLVYITKIKKILAKIMQLSNRELLEHEESGLFKNYTKNLYTTAFIDIINKNGIINIQYGYYSPVANHILYGTRTGVFPNLDVIRDFLRFYTDKSGKTFLEKNYEKYKQKILQHNNSIGKSDIFELEEYDENDFDNDFFGINSRTRSISQGERMLPDFVKKRKKKYAKDEDGFIDQMAFFLGKYIEENGIKGFNSIEYATKKLDGYINNEISKLTFEFENSKRNQRHLDKLNQESEVLTTDDKKNKVLVRYINK